MAQVNTDSLQKAMLAVFFVSGMTYQLLFSAKVSQKIADCLGIKVLSLK